MCVGCIPAPGSGSTMTLSSIKKLLNINECAVVTVIESSVILTNV